MSNQVIQVANGAINSMVVAYQSQPTEKAYMEIHEAVFPMAEQVAYSHFHNSKGLKVPKDEFVQCARIAIFKAVDAFDISKGSNFTSLVKQLVQWTINDVLFKPAKKLSNKLLSTAISLDKPVTDDEGKSFVGSANELPVVQNIPSILDELIAEQENTHDYSSLTGILLKLVKDFSLIGKADDVQIIKLWVGVALTQADQADQSDLSRVVNKALKEIFPTVTSSSLRKKKERAEERFNKFAHEQGYQSFKLSHF